MDKYEYKLRAAEIKDLLDQHQFARAMEVCDLIDWKRVKNISMLCKVSEIYKVNRKYEEAKDILLIAYERYPGGKMIMYNLCELYIKIGDIVQAWECYKEFVAIAPKDSSAYILQYKLYEAQEVSIEERIEVLKTFKDKEYQEKWAYELAYLYHKIGQETNCVEECDELILWFGEGKYVKKALELKKMHQPLSPTQQEKYDALFGIVREDIPEEEESVEEYSDVSENAVENDLSEEVVAENTANEEAEVPGIDSVAEGTHNTIHTGETIEIAPVNVDKFSTMNLQAELSKSMQQVMEDEPEPEIPQYANPEAIPVQDEIIPSSEQVIPGYPDQIISNNEELVENNYSEEEDLLGVGPSPEGYESALDKTQNIGEPLINSMLSQGSDGQISLVVPEDKEIEKQITGQMDFTEVMKEWDRIRQEGNQELIRQAQQRVIDNTSELVSKYGTSPLPYIDKVNENDFMSTAEMPSVMPAASEEFDIPTGELPSAEEFISAIEEDAENETSEDMSSDDAELMEESLEKESENNEEVPVVDESYPEEESEEEVEEDEDEETDDSDEEEDEDDEEDLNPSIEDEIEENFGEFLKLKKMRSSIREVLRKARMMGNAGNVIITGNESSVRLKFALAIAKSLQNTDVDFTGKVAKIDAVTLNNKDVVSAVKKLQGGALIIENAGELNINTMDAMIKAVNNPDARLLFILEDEKSNIRKLQKMREYVDKVFNVSVTIPTYSNNDLVEHAKEYALEREYSIDDMGMLALYKRIDELQTASHYVTIKEVEQIMDEAIESADKKNVGHLMDILFAKRYDDDDLIILKEKDFIHK